MAALVARRQRRLLLPLLLLIRAVGGAAPPAARRATADARASGAELRARGFALVRGEVESPLVDAVGAHARGTLDELLARVAAKGGDVLEQRYSFAEVCHRQRLRWDVRLPDTPSWRRLRARALQLAAPAIAEAAGGGGAAGPCRVREAMSGVVISRPGARAQSFHADGNVGGLFSVFVPLLPVRADGDGTQVRRAARAARRAPRARPPLTPAPERLGARGAVLAGLARGRARRRARPHAAVGRGRHGVHGGAGRARGRRARV